jgi:outer membrane protein assembly factor BamB
LDLNHNIVLSGLLCGALALSTLTGGVAQAAPPASFEDLGTFIGAGGAKGTLVAPGPNGTERLYTNYTYLSSMDIVGFERGTGKYKVWRSDEGGAWAMETDADGRLYIGTYYKGHLIRLDPKTDKLKDFGQAVSGEEYIWNLSLGPDKMLYGCTFPGAKLFRFDPKTEKITDLGRMDPVDKYNRTLCAAPDGWVYCATGSEKANLVAYNIATKERRELIPAADRKPGFGTIVRGADQYAYATYFGKTYQLRDGAATEITELPALRERLKWADGETAKDPGTYVGRALPIFRVATGPDKKIYASGVLPEYLLRFDPADKKLVTMGLIPGAEAYSMLAAYDKLFIASYTGATLQVYDPSQPFKPGQKRENNPSYYGSSAPDQNRPYDMTMGPDGKIYIANVPGYGIVGGALAWYDPKTDAIDHVPTPLAGHSIASVQALTKPLLAVGTSTEAGSGARSVVTEASLFFWDTEKKTVAWQGVPVLGAKILSNLALGGDGLLYVSTEKEIFAFDTTTHTVVGKTALKEGSVIRAGMLALDDGRVVVITKSSAQMIRFANGKWTTDVFATTKLTMNTGKAVLDGWLYAAADNKLVRCKLPSP